MLVCMRTTINLHDGLAEAAKRKARAEGRTFTSLVEEGLRSVLERSEAVGAVVKLPSYGNASVHPLVDLADRDAMAEALDADGIR